MQGDYDQHFFADLDHAHVDIESKQVQKIIGDHGLMIGSAGAGCQALENQLWGFDRSRLNFFKEYYAEGLRKSYSGEIAYSSLYPKVRRELNEFESTPTEQICLPIGSIGLAHAEQPGHEWSPEYHGRSTVTSSELTAIFSARSAKIQPAAEQAAAVFASAPGRPAVSAARM